MLYRLPFQVGDKHVPVAASADFHFDDVVKRIFRPVWLFQAVAFDIVGILYSKGPRLSTIFLFFLQKFSRCSPARRNAPWKRVNFLRFS